ncbi:MAG: VF530 family DNA-binding protein [Novipirellula sp. JB048]
MTTPPSQPNNPLHGITLAALLEDLVQAYGWTGLSDRIAIRCFTHNPSIKSSLRFLRRTEWARRRVEQLYLDMLSHPEESLDPLESDSHDHDGDQNDENAASVSVIPPADFWDRARKKQG